MTLALIEGYDHIDTVAKFAAKSWQNTAINAGTFGITTSVIAGRIDGQAIRMTGNGGETSFTAEQAFVKFLPSTYTQFVCGFALRISVLPVNASLQVFAVRVGSTQTVRVFVTTAGKIAIQNSSGTVIGTGTAVITAAAWHYIEFKVVINGASGSVQTQVNGAADLGSTTGNFGSTAVDNVAVWSQSTNRAALIFVGTCDHDDIYFANTASSPNNNFLGDVHVDTLYPSGAGANNDFTPNTGSTHYNLVNEQAGTFPDDNTTYVSSSTLNHKDSYVYDDLSILSGTVFGVQTNLYARKDDAALRQLQPLVRQASTDYLSGTNFSLATSYVDGTFIWETDPSTSAAWLIAGVNSAEFGVKVTT